MKQYHPGVFPVVSNAGERVVDLPWVAVLLRFPVPTELTVCPVHTLFPVGCVVNGPGESKHANIGISLPGTFEEPKAPVYVDGRLMTTLRGDTIVQDFQKILDEYVKTRYGTRSAKEELVVAH